MEAAWSLQRLRYGASVTRARLHTAFQSGGVATGRWRTKSLRGGYFICRAQCQGLGARGLLSRDADETGTLRAARLGDLAHAWLQLSWVALGLKALEWTATIVSVSFFTGWTGQGHTRHQENNEARCCQGEASHGAV